MRVGDLVRMKGFSEDDWNGQIGIVTKIRRSTGGAWAVLLTSGVLVATYNRNHMVVLNESR